MGVFAALSDGIGAIKRNPMIVGLVFAYVLASGAVSGLQAVDPLLASLGILVLYLFVPFFLGGIIGTIHEGLDGRTSLGRFVDAGTSSYLPLLGGGLLFGAVTVVLYFVVGVVAFFIGIIAIAGIGSAGASGLGGLSVAAMVLLALLGLGTLAISLVPLFVLQFFPAAVVVDDLGLVDSFKRSGGVVRRNFLSVLGFDALAFLIGLFAQIPTAYLLYELANAPGEPSVVDSAYDALSATEFGVYLALLVVLGTIVGSVTQSFYVAFYDGIPRGDAA